MVRDGSTTNSGRGADGSVAAGPGAAARTGGVATGQTQRPRSQIRCSLQSASEPQLLGSTWAQVASARATARNVAGIEGLVAKMRQG